MKIKKIFKIKDSSEFLSELQSVLCMDEGDLDVLELSKEERVFCWRYKRRE